MTLAIDGLELAWNFKTSLGELFYFLWNYQFSPLPVVATYLLFDITWIVRALYKRHYVPMYFMFFPSGHPDELYARYLREDNALDVAPKLTPTQRKRVSRQIRISATISMLLATVVTPWLIGAVAACYLTFPQFVEFVILLVSIKSIAIYTSLRTLRRESPAASSRKSFSYLIALYGIYLVLIIFGLAESFSWVSENLGSYSLAGLLTAFFRNSYYNIFLSLIVSTLAVYVFNELFLSQADKRD